ncbi:MAG TPA: hypothetical protein VIC58_04340 [Actinomycetota bacterium]|jgi:hypothetical protein
MCLACTTPVRGETYGGECLGTVLGANAPAAEVEPRPARPSRTLTRVAFGVAVAATLLPWSRFGPGSEALGAWSRSARWSLVAAAAAIAGLAISLAQRSERRQTAVWDVTVAMLGAVVVLASLFAVLFPPDFSRPWLGPWVAAGAGAVACGAAVIAGRMTTSPSTVRS